MHTLSVILAKLIWNFPQPSSLVPLLSSYNVAFSKLRTYFRLILKIIRIHQLIPGLCKMQPTKHKSHNFSVIITFDLPILSGKPITSASKYPHSKYWANTLSPIPTIYNNASSYILQATNKIRIFLLWLKYTEQRCKMTPFKWGQSSSIQFQHRSILTK